ncbi:MAG: DUF6364 family protein [Verrucomicrobiae bacterium]|nr:DUF6364 family protein [Verrucomicrobiae bacterium]
MDAKLTLRLEDTLIRRAKKEACRRGKSVSQMVSDFFNSLRDDTPDKTFSHPPITTSLVGLLKNSRISEDHYKKHLREKYL